MSKTRMSLDSFMRRDLLQIFEHAVDLVACADGDSHCTRVFVTAIANQDAAIAKLVADLDCPFTEVRQHKVALALPIRNMQFLKTDVEQLAGGENFCHIFCDVRRVLHGGTGGERRERVDAIWRL